MEGRARPAGAGSPAARAAVRVTLPDGSVREVPAGTTPREVAEAVGPRLAKAAVAARVNGQVVDLDRPMPGDASLEILTFDDPAGREVYRHTAAHILAQAVKRLFPEAKLTIGPPIEDGFYYDFDVRRPFSPEDLERIEAEMQAIIRADYPVRREELDRPAAVRLFRGLGEDYKLEIIDGLEPDAPLSVYRQGEFVDLCRGPHLPSTGRVKVVKLLSAAGAYWRGDESRAMLQRIYGTAFERRADLEAYLHRLEEARRRDHRRLGRELDLYSIADEVGPGLILWHPRGGRLRQALEDFWREEHRKRGYELVFTPHIGQRRLWERSGHWEKYHASMYRPIEVDGVEYLLKPMNCPFHVMIYKAQPRSYRDLPLKLCEFGTVYRYERSGTLHGLLRVRGFTQDDAHLFVRPDQIGEVLAETVEFGLYFLRTCGFSDFTYYLSLRDPSRPEDYIGGVDVWDRAEAELEAALKALEVPYVTARGEANFYGPKVDISMTDVLGRQWQACTVQLDFTLPERFDLEYRGADNRPHRPVMIHRALFGSMERFVGLLIEQHAGAFPVWLAPEQARLLPITDRAAGYAQQVLERLRDAGFRAELDAREETIGYKIRQAQLDKVPYMLVVGDREQAQGTVSVRHREQGDLGPEPVDAFVARLSADVTERR